MSKKKAKKEGRYTPVLTFSLMLDANNSLNPAIEVSKVDADDFIQWKNIVVQLRISSIQRKLWNKRFQTYLRYMKRLKPRNLISRALYSS